jgi:hypothetical protein
MVEVFNRTEESIDTSDLSREILDSLIVGIASDTSEAIV